MSSRWSALLAPLAAGLVVTGCGSSGSSSPDEQSSPRAALHVEIAVAPGGEGTELIVEVAEPDRNVPESAGNRTSVVLECVDESGAVRVRGRHPWPFTDTDEGLVAAHVHQPVPPAEVSRIKRCRLQGTRGPLSGRVTGPGVR